MRLWPRSFVRAPPRGEAPLEMWPGRRPSARVAQAARRERSSETPPRRARRLRLLKRETLASTVGEARWAMTAPQGGPGSGRPSGAVAQAPPGEACPPPSSRRRPLTSATARPWALAARSGTRGEQALAHACPSAVPAAAAAVRARPSPRQRATLAMARQWARAVAWATRAQRTRASSIDRAVEAPAQAPGEPSASVREAPAHPRPEMLARARLSAPAAAWARRAPAWTARPVAFGSMSAEKMVAASARLPG